MRLPIRLLAAFEFRHILLAIMILGIVISLPTPSSAQGYPAVDGLLRGLDRLVGEAKQMRLGQLREQQNRFQQELWKRQADAEQTRREALDALEMQRMTFRQTQQQAIQRAKNSKPSGQLPPEQQAAIKLKQAKQLYEFGQKDDAREYCEDILARYPNTPSAKEAMQLLDKVKQ